MFFLLFSDDTQVKTTIKEHFTTPYTGVIVQSHCVMKVQPSEESRVTLFQPQYNLPDGQNTCIVAMGTSSISYFPCVLQSR